MYEDGLEIYGGRHGHNQKFECRTDVDDYRKKMAMNICCHGKAHGKLDKDRTSVSVNSVCYASFHTNACYQCEVKSEDLSHRFEECMEEHFDIPPNEVECSPESRGMF